MKIYLLFLSINIFLSQEKNNMNKLLDYDIFKFHKKSISYFRNNNVHLINKKVINKLGYVNISEKIETKGKWNLEIKMNFEFESKLINSKFAILLNDNNFFEKFQFYNNSNFLNINEYFEGIIIYGEINSSLDEKVPIISQIFINKINKDGDEIDYTSILRNSKLCKTNFYHNKSFTIKLEYEKENLKFSILEKTDEKFNECGSILFPGLMNFNFSIGGINQEMGTNLYINQMNLDNLKNKFNKRIKSQNKLENFKRYLNNINEENLKKRKELKNKLNEKFASYIESTPKEIIENLKKDIKNDDSKLDYGLKILSSQAINLEDLKDYLVNYDSKMINNEDKFLSKIYNTLADIEKSTDIDNEEIDHIFNEIEEINYETKVNSILDKTNLIIKKIKVINQFSNLVKNNKMSNTNLDKWDDKFKKIQNVLRNKFVQHSENKRNYIKTIAIGFFYILSFLILFGFIYIYIKLNKSKKFNRI